VSAVGDDPGVAGLAEVSLGINMLKDIVREPAVGSAG